MAEPRINLFTLNGMLQYTQQWKEKLSLNPLIDRNLLQNKCNKQQLQLRARQISFSFFFLPFTLPFSSPPQFLLTKCTYNEKSPAFHLGGKMHPRHSSLSFLFPGPHPPTSTLYMHFISVKWIPGRKLLSHPEVKKKTVHFHISIRGTQSGHFA